MKFTFVESVGKQKLLRNEKIVDFIDDTGVEDQVINIYPQIKYQTFEGFGGAITDAAGYVFQQMNDVQQKELLTKYFDPDHMNYVRVRIHMDSCDFSTHLYSAIKDPQDRNLESFDFTDTEIYSAIVGGCTENSAKTVKNNAVTVVSACIYEDKWCP